MAPKRLTSSNVENDVPDHSLVTPASHGDLLIALCQNVAAGNVHTLAASEMKSVLGISVDIRRFRTVSTCGMKQSILKMAQQPWFRSCMKISLMEIMVSTHLNTVWISIFESMNTFSDLVGPDQSNPLIQCSDIQFFSENYGSESSLVDVQNIYFPAKKPGESVPLEIPITYENMKFEFRRKGLLEKFSDDEYYKSFVNISQNNNRKQPISYSKFTSLLRNEGSITAKILYYVVWWFNPKFFKPHNSSRHYRGFLWTAELSEHVLGKRNPDRLGESMQEGGYKSCSQLSDFDAACKMVEKIFKQLDDPHSFLRDCKQVNETANLREYTYRIRRPEWMAILELAWSYVDNHFVGFMAEYNDYENIISKEEPWTVWGPAIQKSMMTTKFEVNNLPCLKSDRFVEDLISRGAIFAAGRIYAALKQWLLENPEKPRTTGTPSDGNMTGNIMDAQQYELARKQLFIQADFLSKHGIVVNVKNDCEDLDMLCFCQNNHKSSTIDSDISASSSTDSQHSETTTSVKPIFRRELLSSKTKPLQEDFTELDLSSSKKRRFF